MSGMILRHGSDRELMREVRPFLEEAYGPLPANEAWLLRLVRTIRSQMEQMTDAVSLSEWALADTFTRTQAAEEALASEPARPVLVQFVAQLARVVLLDEATAQQIVKYLHQQLAEEHGWQAAEIDRPLEAALTGRLNAPPLPQVMALLGKERCMRRSAAVLRA